jgi:ribose/xylose/arabinose/galactoside ABC-type transport system permease subunit
MSTTTSTPAENVSLRQRWERLVRSGTGLNIIGLLVAIVLLYIVLSATATGFTSAANQFGMLRDAAMIGVVATGMTLVIIAGEIDVSIGPAVALSSVIFAKAMTAWGLPAIVAILVTLLFGGLWGSVVGYLRARIGVPSFIGTLGLWNILGGLALFTTDALPVPIPLTDPTVDLLSSRILGLPTPAWVMLLAFVVFGFVSTRTAYGRSVFAVGGNSSSARLAGINVAKIRTLIFVTTGMLSALSGVLLAARLGSGNGGAAKGLEFSIIAAVVVGGTAMTGGRGSLLGTFLGVIFITLLGNGLVLLGVNSFLQQVVSGAIIVVAVLLNVLMSRRGGHATTD